MKLKITGRLFLLTLLATFLLTFSALTQGDFILNSEDEQKESKESENIEKNIEKIIETSPGSVQEENKETYQKSDSEQIEVKETEEIETQISPMDEFMKFIKPKTNGQVDLADLKMIAKNTELEIKEISKKTKETSLEEVNKKSRNSDNLDIIVWVKKEYSYKKVLKNLKNFEVKYVFDEVNGFSGKASKETINSLKRDRRVDYITFDAPVKTALAESVPLIQADSVSANFSLNGEGIGICHLDTGINYNIPELAHAYAGGYDFVNNDPDPFDDNGHGTVTAGVLVSNDQTEKGIASQARLYAVKVLNSTGFGFSSSVSAGINWCLQNKDILNISVISASLATFETYDQANHPGYSEVALQTAYNSNLPVVACTGNTGNISGVAYPAVSPYVIPVSGVYDSNIGQFNYQFPGNNFSCSDQNTSADQIPCFANRADFVEFLAPASIITTTSWFGGTMDISGTSVASPHVAATIALMKQRNPQMTVPQIKQILSDTGVNVYDNQTGLTFKRINALEAVKAVPYLTKIGVLAQGNTINLEVSDPINPGAIYFAVLSFGNDNGIPLPNGLILPVNPDGLFTYSLSPNPLISNNIGFLDNNGKATATVIIPPIAGIENFTIYAGFATARNDFSEFLSVSNSEKL